MVKLVLRYGELEITPQTPILTVNTTEEQPDIGISSSEPGVYYTLILYDPDAAKPLWLHWIVENLNPLEMSHVNQAMIYYGPHPPKGQTHRYIASLYRQEVLGMHQFNPKDRPDWTLDEILSPLNISSANLLDTIEFRVKADF